MMARTAGPVAAGIAATTRRATASVRPAWDRAVAAHRRYAAGNGDALAGALTYALLICGTPALLLAITLLSALGVDPAVVSGQVRRSAGLLLPRQLAQVVDQVPQVPLALGLGLAAGVAWMALRLVRALRTGVRAMCGQQAGSGNPVRDALRDAVLGALLLAVMSVIVVVTAAAYRRPGAAAAGVAAICVLFTGVMLLGSWPGPGRPAASAALRASLGAAVAVGLLTLGAGWYFAATSSFHGLIFQPAGALVGVLVWCNLTCRVLLRAVAWASTAGTREVATDGS